MSSLISAAVSPGFFNIGHKLIRRLAKWLRIFYGNVKETLNIKNTRVTSSNVTQAEQINLPGVPVRQPKLQWFALLEIAVFLGTALLIDYFLFDGTRFRQMEPHPFWILVLLISAQYGTRYGLIAVLAASIMYLLGNVPDRTIEQNIHHWLFVLYKLPIMWIFSSVIIGEISVRHINKELALNESLDERIRREATLSETFHEIKAIKEKLEIRAAGQSRTIRKTLRAARDMASQERMQVLERAQDLVTSMLEPDKFSIYVLKENELQLVFEHGWSETDDFLRSFSNESELFKSVAGERKVLCIAVPADESILEEQGLLAGPLIEADSGELFGMLKIEKQSFSKLSLNTIKDFNSIREWIGSVYSKAVR